MAWTHRPCTWNHIRPSSAPHQILTVRHSPSPVSSCRPLVSFVSNPRITVGFRTDPGPSFFNDPRPCTTDNQGWTAFEVVTIQLNTSFAPSGRFPVYSNKSLPDINGTETRIGYDAAACLQKYESWIIEAYHTSSGSSSLLQVVGKVDDSTSPSPGLKSQTPDISIRRERTPHSSQLTLTALIRRRV